MSIVLPNVCAAVSEMEEVAMGAFSIQRETSSEAVFPATLQMIPHRTTTVSNFGLYEDTVEKFCIHWDFKLNHDLGRFSSPDLSDFLQLAILAGSSLLWLYHGTNNDYHFYWVRSSVECLPLSDHQVKTRESLLPKTKTFSFYLYYNGCCSGVERTNNKFYVSSVTMESISDCLVVSRPSEWT